MPWATPDDPADVPRILRQARAQNIAQAKRLWDEAKNALARIADTDIALVQLEDADTAVHMVLNEAAE